MNRASALEGLITTFVAEQASANGWLGRDLYVILVPCVGFTESCLRLGYGGGYFDRTLARSPRPRAIGIAYAFTRVSFEASAYDLALDLIISDE